MLALGLYGFTVKNMYLSELLPNLVLVIYSREVFALVDRLGYWTKEKKNIIITLH